MINQKGQSLVELASFGAVLLFCLGILIQYGMRANYQQDLQMQAFRKAMKIAYYKHGPGAAASLSIIEDKAIPDPRDPWGFAGRQTVSASASVSWDSNLQALYIDDFDEPEQDSDLPYQLIEINDTQGAFKTAGYAASGCNGSIMIVLENPPEKRESLHEEYREKTIDCSQIKVLNRGTEEGEVGKLYPYVKIDELKHKISSADVDGDGELETIIAVKGTLYKCEDNGYCGGVSSFKYVDQEEGDIDTKYAAIYPWEAEKDRDGDGKLSDEQQGLIGNSTLTKIDDNRLVKTDDSSEISTTTYLEGEQSITHYIRLNNKEEPEEYTTTFAPAEREFTWGVSK